MKEVILTWLQVVILKAVQDENMWCDEKGKYEVDDFGTIRKSSVKKLQYLGLIEEHNVKSVFESRIVDMKEYTITDLGREVLAENELVVKRRTPK